MDKQDVEKGREAEFTVGDLEGVAAVVHIPSNKCVEVFWVDPPGLRIERKHMNGAGYQPGTDTNHDPKPSKDAKCQAGFDAEFEDDLDNENLKSSNCADT